MCPDNALERGDVAGQHLQLCAALLVQDIQTDLSHLREQGRPAERLQRDAMPTVTSGKASASTLASAASAAGGSATTTFAASSDLQGAAVLRPFREDRQLGKTMVLVTKPRAFFKRGIAASNRSLKRDACFKSLCFRALLGRDPLVM